jgi:hypothetical protein
LYDLFREVGDEPEISFLGLESYSQINRSVFGELGTALVAVSSAGGLGVLGRTLVAVLRNRRSVIEISVGDAMVRIDGTVENVEKAVAETLAALTAQIEDMSGSDE